VDNQEINVQAFLKLIRYAEHKREDTIVYYLLYGGTQTFSDLSRHPDKQVKAWGKESTAAGAYHILKSSYDEAVAQEIIRDFTPASQDAYALWILRTRGVLELVKAGDISHAIFQLRNDWLSLPGTSQSKMTMQEARERFERYVKEFRDMGNAGKSVF
jgi:muramidase (phage lysozyme)